MNNRCGILVSLSRLNVFGLITGTGGLVFAECFLGHTGLRRRITYPSTFYPGILGGSR